MGPQATPQPCGVGGIFPHSVSGKLKLRGVQQLSEVTQPFRRRKPATMGLHGETGGDLGAGEAKQIRTPGNFFGGQGH